MRIPSVTLDLPAVGGKFEELRNRDWRKYWMTSPADRAALIYLLRSISAEIVAEVGVNLGYTAKCLLDNVATIKNYIGIDVTKEHVPASPRQKGEVPAIPGQVAMDDGRLKLIIRKSGSLDVTLNELPRLDAMIIDGDHDYNVVKHDSKLARYSVRGGGLIIWHDYHEGSTEGVRDLLDEMYDRGAPIKHIAHTWLAFETVN